MISQEAQWLLREKYNGEKNKAFYADLARLESGEPLAYIIGHIPFLDCTIYLDNCPLIPRVETEYWISQAIQEIKSEMALPPHVLDLCAGSGCIGVAVAHALPDATVHFAEYDQALHATIQKNIDVNGIERSKTRILGGDVFADIEERYDFILSNPPYLPLGSTYVAETVKRFEPSLALYGGKKGTDIIERILNDAQKHLSDSGVLYFEHEPEQAEAIATLAAKNALTCTTHTDQYKTPRYSRCTVAQ